MNFDAILLTAVTFFSTLSGGLVALRYLGRYKIITAFAAGVLIAVPLFDLLPESVNIAISIGANIIQPFWFAAAGFVFLMILERYVSVTRVCDEDGCHNVRHRRAGYYGAGELAIHSYLDGFAIGLGFQASVHVGLIVAMAVIFHDFSDGLNTVTLMLQAGNSREKALRMLLLDAVTPILGAATTLFFVLPESLLILFLPFFAGGFLYLGASELLPGAHRENPPLDALLMTLAGFVLIFAVTYLLNV